MPTYRNDSGEMIFIKDLVFQPFETRSSKYILSHPSLIKVSDEPYYNPVIKDQIYTGGINEVIEIPIDPECNEIFIRSLGPQLEVNFNTISNSPALYIIDRAHIRNPSLYEKLIIKFKSSGQINVKQLREKIEL